MTLSVSNGYLYAECSYTGWNIYIDMLSVIKLFAIMSVVMLGFTFIISMLSVV
jgi:hypothetical protein